MMSSDSIPVRRGPKPNLKGNPDTNVYVSVMAQFSKDTYLFLKLSRSKSKTPIIIFIYCAKVFKVLVNIVVIIIINKPTRSTFGPLGSGRLPETPGMRVTFWCTQRRAQHYINLSPTEFQKEIICSLLPILMQHCSLPRDSMETERA